MKSFQCQHKLWLQDWSAEQQWHHPRASSVTYQSLRVKFALFLRTPLVCHDPPPLPPLGPLLNMTYSTKVSSKVIKMITNESLMKFIYKRIYNTYLLVAYQSFLFLCVCFLNWKKNRCMVYLLCLFTSFLKELNIFILISY